MVGIELGGRILRHLSLYDFEKSLMIFILLAVVLTAVYE